MARNGKLETTPRARPEVDAAIEASQKKVTAEEAKAAIEADRAARGKAFELAIEAACKAHRGRIAAKPYIDDEGRTLAQLYLRLLD